MSIIQEALKRAQYNYASRKGLQKTREEPGQQPTIPVSNIEAFDIRTIAKKIGVVVYVIVLLALVTGFGIRALFSKITTMDKERRSKDLIVTMQKAPTDKKDTPSSTPPAAIEQATEKPLALASSGQVNQPPSIVLNGIMYTKERPKAIINGTVVRKGDVIGGATVASITENNVLLKYNSGDNQIELMLKLKE